MAMFSFRGGMMRYGYLTVGLAALALSGCEAIPNQATTNDPNFGRALRQNIAAQIADPAPNYAYDNPPASSGPRTSVAQKRYDTGTVLQPQAQSTSDAAGGGSGGGGSGK
jgi:hypothetical protein